MHADESAAWNRLHDRYDLRRGAYLDRYAQEAAYREDNRRRSNGDLCRSVLALVSANKPSIDFCGYWQRNRTAAKEAYT